MSLVKTELFKIDGAPMYAPDTGVAISWQDILGADSGLDQAGNMHRLVVRHDVGTWVFQYFALTDEELTYMQSLFAGKAEFDFTHPDPFDNGKTITVKAYRNMHNVTWRNATTGDFRNYRVTIVESGDSEDGYV